MAMRNDDERDKDDEDLKCETMNINTNNIVLVRKHNMS